jgi:hypothetical protein
MQLLHWWQSLGGRVSKPRGMFAIDDANCGANVG